MPSQLSRPYPAKNPMTTASTNAKPTALSEAKGSQAFRVVRAGPGQAWTHRSQGIMLAMPTVPSVRADDAANSNSGRG